jgi:hypothetical protein
LQARRKNPAGAKKPQMSTIDKKNAFLAAYRVCATVKGAARAARIGRQTHYDWLREDADYHVKFRAAVIEAVGALEDEAVERATIGVFEPNVFQGRFVYPQEEYVVREAHGREPEVRAWRDKPGAAPLGIWRKSDFLLAFLLRGAMPEKYKPGRHLEIPAAHTGPISLTEQNLSKLTNDELKSLRILAGKLAA